LAASCKWAFAVDYPISSAERRQVGGKGTGLVEVLELGIKAQLFGAMDCEKLIQE
jgi:hypothetical protein